MNIKDYIEQCDIQGYYVDDGKIHIHLHHKSNATSIIKGIMKFDYKEIMHFKGRKIVVELN